VRGTPDPRDFTNATRQILKFFSGFSGGGRRLTDISPKPSKAVITLRSSIELRV